MIIKKACKFCGKTTDITSELNLGSSGKMFIFKCGHSYIEKSVSLDQESDVESLLSRLEKAIPEYCEIHDRKCIKVITSKTGKHLFPYQRDGIVRAAKANAKFIFADEMGLGKTVQGLITIATSPDELLPGLFVCKSIAKTNWLRETMDWLGIPAQVIYKTSDTPFDIFKVHIISYDMMNRLDKLFKFSEMKDQVYCPECDYREDEGKHQYCPECSRTKSAVGDVQRETIEENGKIITKVVNTQVFERKSEVPELIPWIDKTFAGQENSLRDQNKNAWFLTIKRCKTLILDEVHLVKSQTAQRTRAIKNIAKLIPHVLPMSGTLIKNNAPEYFTPLNIVKPERYWRYESFCRNHCRWELVRTAVGTSYKFTGLIDPESFKHETEGFMIRRTTDEVLPELPKLFKQQKYVELDDDFKDLYEESEKDFAKWFTNASSVDIRTDLLAKLALLRHQTSLAKVSYTIDLALEFILSCNRKLAIFTHHIDSREFLAERMIKFFKETSEGQDKDVVRILGVGKDVQEEIEEFKNSESARILILSTLSHGESINLQFMSDCILHERQWNPANENQAISGRFRRIGQESKVINCMIPVAIGTIDEFFVELDGRKEAIGREIDTGQIESYNSNFVIELAEMIAKKGREKWRL